MNFSSSPANSTPDQYRRCAGCGAGGIYPFHPGTAIACACGGELLVTPITVAHIVAERARCADALVRLADRCLGNQDGEGKVSAGGAAAHMVTLAEWMRGNG